MIRRAPVARFVGHRVRFTRKKRWTRVSRYAMLRGLSGFLDPGGSDSRGEVECLPAKPAKWD